MASIKGHKSTEMGLHEEVLTGRTLSKFFLILKNQKIFSIMTPMMLISINEQK